MNFSWPHKAAHRSARRSAGRVRFVAVTAFAAAAVAGLAVPAVAAIGAPAHSDAHATAKHSTKTTMSAATGYVGSRFTLSARVKGGPTPTGRVKFLDGGKTLCSAKLSGGKAHCTHTFGSAGSFRVEAYYEGNATHKVSSGKATVTVLAFNGTATAVTATPADPYPGQVVTLAATVTSSSAATGTVTFTQGATTLCTAALGGAGTASCDYTWGAAGGPFTVTGTYSGNSTHTGSSGTASVTVAAIATETAITNVNPFTQASGIPWPVDVDVTVPAGDPEPTGTVEVYSLADPGTDVTLDEYTCTFVLVAADDGDGTCSITTPAGAWGFVEFEAIYDGNAEFATSTSGGEHKLINPEPTTTTVGPATATEGDAVTLVATVTPEGGGNLLAAYSDIPDVVNFTVGGEPIADCTGVDITWNGTADVADCTYTPTATGDQAIAAAFPGDEYAGPSTGTETLVVSA